MYYSVLKPSQAAQAAVGGEVLTSVSHTAEMNQRIKRFEDFEDWDRKMIQIHSDHYLPGFSHKLPSHHRHLDRWAILGSPWLLAWHLRDLSRMDADPRYFQMPVENMFFFCLANFVAITSHSIGKCSFRFISKSKLSRNCYFKSWKNESKLRIIIGLNESKWLHVIHVIHVPWRCDMMKNGRPVIPVSQHAAS